MIRILLLSFLFFAFASTPTRLHQGNSDPSLRSISYALPSDSAAFQLIRVRIMKDITGVTFETQDSYQLYDAEDRLLMSGKRMDPTLIRVDEKGLVLSPQLFRTPTLKIVTGGSFKINNYEYWNTLIIRREDKAKISVINELSLENYLRGVLPFEANPKWSEEALKAQAITSRTYALFQMIEGQDKPYVVTNDVLSQVYRGKSIEKKETNAAIEATRGQILVYHGEIFPAYFHSTCGGTTTGAESIWKVKKHAALRGVVCPFCKDSKHYRWTDEISKKDIEVALSEHGLPTEKISEIIALKRDDSGRAELFRIVHSQGFHDVPSNDFRLWVGPFKLKSTLLETIRPTPNSFIFVGQGWGHGVGLCQYGMKKMGELGYEAQKILTYYYPGAEVIQYELQS